MTNKELFVEYLKFNNVVPPDFNQDDLPNWEMFNMDTPQWEYGVMNPMMPMPYGDMALDDYSQRMWNRPNWRRRRPIFRPGYNNNPFIPLFWWWLLF